MLPASAGRTSTTDHPVCCLREPAPAPEQVDVGVPPPVSEQADVGAPPPGTQPPPPGPAIAPYPAPGYGYPYRPYGAPGYGYGPGTQLTRDQAMAQDLTQLTVPQAMAMAQAPTRTL